jgi:DNA-directed RNA polymerase specialized sigma24 family protein
MLRKKETRVSTNRVPVYATADEFCRVFAEDENALYLLAYLLTADTSKAERCFVAGLEDSIQGNRVFKEWVSSWSRRVIIKNAIQMISPALGQLSGAPHVSDSDAFGLNLDESLTGVLQLAPLERFVFVMSVLEGYSLQECAILLNCTKQDIALAQARALQHAALVDVNPIAPVMPGSERASAAHFLEPAQVA